jgi:hypothetical protein
MDDDLFVADQHRWVGTLVLPLSINAVDVGIGVVLTKSKRGSTKKVKRKFDFRRKDGV